MKKKVFALTLVLMMVLFSGCMRFSVEMDFTENGTVDVTMINAMADEVMSFGEDMGSEDSGEGESSGLLDAEAIADLEAEGWEYEEYAQDGFTGYKIVSKGHSIEEVAELFSDTEDSTGLGSETINLVTDGNGNYTLDWKVLDEESESQTADMGEYFDMYDGYLQFVLTVPQGTTANNATSVSDDGNTLTWNLLESDTVHAEFTIPVAAAAAGGSGSGLLIGIIVAIIVLIVVVVLVRKNKGGQAAPAATTPAEPVAPEAPADENKTE